MSKKITDPTCLSCGLYKDCVQPKVKGVGAGPEDVKAILVFPFPEKEDENGNFFQGHRTQTILEMVGADRLDQCYLTYLMKCPAFENVISRNKYRPHNDHEVAHCLKHLARELKQYPNATVMTFGSFSLQAVTGDKDVKITREAGVRRQVKIGATKFTLIPNIDPGSIKHNPNAANEIKAHIEKLFVVANDDKTNQDVSTRYQLLNFDEAMKEMDRAIALYKAGEIPWIIFDYETSVDLQPWGGGEIIMSSFTHLKADVGFAVPFYITNEIHHWNAVPAEDFDLDAYVNQYPHNSKRIRYEDKTIKFAIPEEPGKFRAEVVKHIVVPAMPYDVPPVSFQITEQQRVKLMNKTKELVELIPIAGHNLKYDVKWGAWKGKIDLRKVRIYNDTLNMSFQINNKGPGIDNSLKGQSRKFLNVTDDWERKINDYIGRFRLNKDRHFGMIPTGVLAEYSGLDSYYNKDLLLYYESVMDPGVKPILDMVTSAIIPWADSEIKGMAIDQDMYNFLKTSYENYLEAKRDSIDELPKVKKIVGKYFPALEEANKRKRVPLTVKELRRNAFNLNYSKKVSELIYDKGFYELPQLRQFKSDTGTYSCNADMREYFLTRFLTDDGLAEVLRAGKPDKYELWSEARQFLEMYSDFKRISKLYNDYIMTMPESITDGIYKTSFNLNGTVTGRLSSPFHSMPKGCDIKRLITSRWRKDGGLILAADQSQLELRIAAALSNEFRLIEAFKQGLDAHAVTASVVYNIPLEEVTDAQRNVGKTCNFAMLYGKTKYNLAIDLGITVDEAERILRNFYSSLSDFTKWADERKAEAKETGHVVTVFGRRIPLPKADSQDEYDIAETERLAVNYPIQSSASDVVFESALEIWHRKEQEKLKSIFLATVHDSTEYDVFPGELMKMLKIFKEEGQDKVPGKHPWLTCPLRLDFEIGVTWGGALKCELQELDEKRVVFKAKGLKRDFRILQSVAQRAYRFELDEVEETKIDLKSFADDIFVRDNCKLKAQVCLELK